MKLFTFAVVSAYRNFGTKSGKTSKWGSSRFNSSNSYHENKLSRKPKKPRIEWTDEQRTVLSSISEGKSVFITGSAGTGKTILLKEGIKLLKKLHGPSQVSVTASTGIAACAIKGQTLHSFAGMKITNASREEMLKHILSVRTLRRRWKNVKAWVIDECSMISAEFFGNMEWLARMVRGVNDPWGGIQLVVSGDFFQLRPIPEKGTKVVEYAFESKSWRMSFDLQIELTKIFRQSNAQLVKLLQGIRKGESDPEDLEFLEKYCSDDKPDPSAVQLFPLNKDVDRVNNEKLESLLEKEELVVTFNALDNGSRSWTRHLKKGIAPDELSLCKGARVMLIQNVNTWRGLGNGATGVVVGFYNAPSSAICPQGLLPIVEFDSGKTLNIKPGIWFVADGGRVVAQRQQVPLILSWAISIHKCQGMTLDRVHTNLSRAFCFGMVYVALSRVRTLEALHLSGFAHSKIQADPKVLEFYKSFALEQGKKIIKDTSVIPEKLSTGETKYHFSLSSFLSARQKSGLK